MSHGHLLKSTVKRGALLAAANWPLTLVQATAEMLFKLVIAVPLLGGIFLVALVLGADPDGLLSPDWREMAAATVAALLSHPVVLVAFLLAVGVAAIGGSLLVYLVKAGAVAVMVKAERDTDAIETAPLQLDHLARTSRFSVDMFIGSARALFPRYTRLGLMLTAMYLASGAAYFALMMASRTAGESWAVAALLTAVFVCWITAINLLYLLTQLVVAADDCSVATAARRVVSFLRRDWQRLSGVFTVVFVVVIVATGVSFVAAGLLGLIAFVPFVGLAVLPLQLLAWLFRALVFEYIGLTSMGAYLSLYRRASADLAEESLHDRLQPVSVPHGASAP